MNPPDYEDETTKRLREEARQTPAGQLLARMGMDYWDTESCARRVAEHAAEEILALTRRLHIADALMTEGVQKIDELRAAKHARRCLDMNPKLRD